MGQHITKAKPLSQSDDPPPYSEISDIKKNVNNSTTMDAKTFVNEITNIFCNKIIQEKNKECQDKIVSIFDELVRKQKSYYDHVVYNTELCEDFDKHDKAMWDEIVESIVTFRDNKGEIYYYPWNNLPKFAIYNLSKKHNTLIRLLVNSDKSKEDGLLYYFEKTIPFYNELNNYTKINDIGKRVQAICQKTNPIKELNNLKIQLSLYDYEENLLTDQINFISNFYNSNPDQKIKVHVKHRVIAKKDWYTKVEISFVFTYGKIVLNVNNVVI